MMKIILSILVFLHVGNAYCQNKPYPDWIRDSLKSKSLDRKYELDSYATPSYFQADFNGDGFSDIAVLILEKVSRKKGVLLIHGHSLQYYIFGAGINFGDGSDNFGWVNKWSVYKRKAAYETQFDKRSGDILGGKEIKLKRPCLSLASIEDGAEISGGLIYWKDRKYVWIHQGE